MNIATSSTGGKSQPISNVRILLSIVVSALVAITSVLGIFFEKTYSRETEAWAIQAIGQDYANLAVVIILLVSAYYVSKESLRAYFVWLGAHIYLVYAFAIYAFFVHFNFLFLVYVLILGLAFYTLVGGLMTLDTASLPTSFLLNAKSKMVSALLMVIGIMFGSLWLGEIIPHLLSGTIPNGLAEAGLWVNPVHVLDLAFLLPGMIITSVLLWRKKLWGFLLAVPLLVFSATMGMGIIAMFIISAMRGMPSSLPAGMIVGLIMLISVYLAGLFLKEI